MLFLFLGETLRSVVFPQPLGPSRANTDPRSTHNLTSSAYKIIIILSADSYTILDPGRRVAKLVARLRATAALWVPIQKAFKNHKWASGRTKYSGFVSKLNKLSEEYLSPQKTQKAEVFFIRKILGGRMI